MILSSTIEEIRNKADILQIVGEYVPLKQRGKNHIGLCPFHSEKTPSFTVSPDKQIFHCFGCNEGGNVFAFLMKAENISFAEAVQMLGERLGITVKMTGGSPALTGEKDRYMSIMELAEQYYLEQLGSEGSSAAREYLEKRGMSGETAKAFSLGFAPDKWDGLLNYLFKKGVSYKDMEKLGLIIERSDKSGYYDRFRGRLMFPIFNIRGRVLGFSGRILAGTEEAKYINSPDSPIYNKGYNLYGINITKDDIKKEKTAVLVEGNVDLISCWQHDIKNVVAPLGTALTNNQAKLLARFAEKVVIAFDQDNAGGLATARSVDILKAEGMDVYVCTYEGGKDPDDALRSRGADSFMDSIKAAVPWMEYKIMQVMAKHNLSEIESRAKAAKEAASVIGQEKEELVQKGYIKMVAEKLGFSFEEVSSEVKKLGFYVKRGEDTQLRRTVEKPAAKLEQAEKMLIKLSLDNKGMLDIFKQSLSWEEFTGPVLKTIAELLQSVDLDTHENLTHFMLENLPDDESKKMLSKIMVSEYPQGNTEQSAKDCINTIKAHHLKTRLDQLRGRIMTAEKDGEIDNVSHLNKEFKDLNEAYRSLSV